MSRNFYTDASCSTLNLDVYKCIPILNKLPLDIECINAYDDYLIVGTKQGHLLMYKLAYKHGADPKFETTIVRSNKAFARKPIVQIEALPEFGILISLSDNLISVHSLDPINSAIICTVEKSRGATTFVTDVISLDTQTGDAQSVLRLCVVVKRKLMLFYWKNNEFLKLAEDLLVPEIPKTIAWFTDSLCVCLKNEYTMIKYLSGEQAELFPINNNEPLIVRLDYRNELALGVDEKTYILDTETKPVLNFPVSWSDFPISVLDDMPYLVALSPKSVIEVQTIEPRLAVQKIAGLPSQSGYLKLLVKCLNKKGRLFIASSSDVYCLTSVSLSQQIQQLLREKQFKLALQLNSQSDETPNSKDHRAKEIENLQAFDLFCKKDFKASMSLFEKLYTDPARVIGLYPDLLPATYRSKIEYPSQPPRLQENDLKTGLVALIEYLIEVRCQLGDAKKSNALCTGISSDPQAIESKKMQLKQIVDTTLLKCYLQINGALVVSLLRLPNNHCHLEESETALKRHHKYNELKILYQSKGLHRRALDLLKIQSTKSGSLAGHEQTIDYLQRLGAENLDLIFEYATWVIKESSEDGLRIFTDDIGLETEQLPREQVFEFLERTDSDLVIPYLEHIISYWNDTTPAFHNTLVHRYREKVRVLLPEYINSLPEGDTPAAPGSEPGELGVYRGKLLNFLETSDHYSTEILPSYLLNDGLFDERAVVMGKVGSHEEALAIYVHILQDTEKAEAYCRRVYDKNSANNRDVFLILLKLYLLAAVGTPVTNVSLSNSSQENVELDTSVSDSATAESSGSQLRNEKYIDVALKLLQNQAPEIDPLKALKLLPTWLPLSSVKNYLVTVTKHVVAERREGQIYRNLLLSQHLQVQAQSIHLQKALKVIVTDRDLCRSCHKRIGKSAFLRFPNGHLVHYSCKDKYNQNNSSRSDHY
ncbi:Vam6/Vps39-like protein [Halotydeus destructor]|nr:Vam6/Vps39-like protein [Halotydeus destructor]